MSFSKYLNYFFVYENEEDFQWGNKEQTFLFINKLEEKYGLQLDIIREA